MKLYINSASPFARKAVALLHEVGSQDEVIFVEVTGSVIDSGSIPTHLNPLAKIPVLEFDDGTVLYDSRVICDYLVERFATRLRPNSKNLWQSRRLEALADGTMDAALLVVYERRLREDSLQSPAWVAGQIAKIDRALDELNLEVEEFSSPVLNRIVTVPCLSVAIMLGYLDFRLPELEWRQGRPWLKAWEADIVRRPSLANTRPREAVPTSS